jgi:outer membrane protein assembly factor BamA
VFVSDASDSALNAVLTPIIDDSTFAAKRLEEPAAFDSVPPLLPSGEYGIKKYKVKFTPDFVGGGFAYDNFFGVQGQTYFLFSDYLGNHEIYVATDLVNTIDQSYIQGYYFNNTRRTGYGVGLFHSKNFYLDDTDSLFSDRFYGVQAFARRPFSMFSRLEVQASQFFIDRKYEDREFENPDRKRNSKVTTLAGAYVSDNVLWGYTGPVNGSRSKLSIDGGVNLFDAGDISFYSVGLDYRKYWHVAQAVSMAFRVSGGASFGKTPKRYFLGGTTNWIGQRTLDATVYEVENLYFSDVVTPLRGQKYYELSGDRYALINWEFRFPTVQVIALKYPLPLVLTNVTGTVFYDMGATWFGDNFKFRSSSDGHSRLADVKTGFGVGIRLNLFGFALLRYDLAWATDYYKIKKPVGYFSFGADF